MVCKLGDFGFARGIHSIDDTGNRTYTICGTDELMAPEMLLSMPYNHAVDIYSFGFVVVEMICGRSPTPVTPSESSNEECEELQGDFLKRLPQDSFDIKFQEVRDCALAGCPVDLIDFAEQCLEYEAADRISAEDFVRSMNQLEKDLLNKTAERIPSKVPPRKWIFDKRRGTFISRNSLTPSSQTRTMLNAVASVDGSEAAASTLSGSRDSRAIKNACPVKLKDLKNAQYKEITMSRSKITSLLDLVDEEGLEDEETPKTESKHKSPNPLEKPPRGLKKVLSMSPSLVSDHSTSPRMVKANGTGAAALLSKHSKTLSLANMARRQLRQLNKSLGVRAMNRKDIFDPASQSNLSIKRASPSQNIAKSTSYRGNGGRLPKLRSHLKIPPSLTENGYDGGGSYFQSFSAARNRKRSTEKPVVSENSSKSSGSGELKVDRKLPPSVKQTTAHVGMRVKALQETLKKKNSRAKMSKKSHVPTSKPKNNSEPMDLSL